MSEISFSVATKDNYDNVNKFYNSQYKSNRPLEYWSWAYDDNPMGKGRLFIAHWDHKIVGIQGVVAYQLSKGKTILQSYKSEDTLVDSTYRGRGIFRDLYKMVHQYIGDNYLWGFTTERSIFDRVCMPSVTRLNTLYMVDWTWVLSCLKKSVNKRTLLLAEIWLTQLTTSFSRTMMDIRIQKTEALSEEDLLFINKNQPQSNFHYSIENIKWRLQDNPLLDDYLMVRGLDKNDKTSDLALLSISGNEAKLLALFQRNDQERQQYFVKQIMKMLKQDKVTVLTAWVASNDEALSKKLNNCGLNYMRKGQFVVENRNLSSEKNMQFSAIHSIT